MKIKSTVRFKEINKYGVQFFAAVLSCELELGLPITLTSANDSIHRPKSGLTSFHGQDQAWDVRINDISLQDAVARRIYLDMKLGYGWDVCIERFDNPANDHIHVERDTVNYPGVEDDN